MNTTTALDPSVDPQIDPQVRNFLKGLNEASKGQTPLYLLPGTGPSDTLTGLQNLTPVDMSGVEISSKIIIEDGVEVPLYIVRPEGSTETLPVIMFYHGGVWLAGNFENHKRYVRDLVVGVNAVAVFPDYTLIPEAKFPTQINQAYAALKWVSAHGTEINVDSKRIAIAGNSVGGNMSAAVALMAKDKNGPEIKIQVLVVPAVGADFTTGSYTAFGEDRFLSKAFMEFGWDLYAPDPETRKNRYAVPLEATVEQLKGLPLTLIQTAENDPLRDEGEAYGRQLREAGVAATTTRYVGMIHDFILLNGINDVPAVQEAIQQAVGMIKAALS